jgi:phosphatidylglycerol:prolipoprotein diacylglycerol transferase
MITWNVNPDLLKLGPLTIRWYGLLFALGFIVGYEIFVRIYKREGKNLNDLNDLLWYMILGTVIGARLGHCLFYDPGYYLSNPLEILMIWHGGLASHGAAIGILTALWLYSRKKPDQPFLWLMDRMVIVVALGGSFIRIGNLFNSEIIGKPTNADWGFIFTRVDNIPRYPSQIFEAAGYFLIFVITLYIYIKYFGKIKDGFIFGVFLILAFTFRFFIEFIKEDQSAFERGMILDMGQILSIPFIIAGVWLIWRTLKSPPNRKK